MPVELIAKQSVTPERNSDGSVTVGQLIAALYQLDPSLPVSTYNQENGGNTIGAIVVEHREMLSDEYRAADNAAYAAITEDMEARGVVELSGAWYDALAALPEGPLYYQGDHPLSEFMIRSGAPAHDKLVVIKGITRFSS